MAVGIAERVVFGRPIDPARDSVTPQLAPRPGAMLIGRILLAAVFLTSGVGKLVGLDHTIARMTSEGIPGAEMLVLVAAFAEIAGGLSILFGFLTRIGAIGLILFLIPTTLIFHDFWTFTGEEMRKQWHSFMKNLGLIGAFALLIAQGPGRYSLDAVMRRPRPA